MGFWRPIAAHLSTSMAFNDNASLCVKNDGLRSKLTQFPGRLPQVLASWCACCACLGKVGNRKPTRKWLIQGIFRQTVDYWVHHSFGCEQMTIFSGWCIETDSQMSIYFCCATGVCPFQVILSILSVLYILEHWSKYPQSFTVCTWRTIILPQFSEGERICMDLYELPSYFEAKNWLTGKINHPLKQSAENSEI
jgi:hypothetical protein